MAQIKILVLGGNGFIGRHILNDFSKKKFLKLYTTSYKKIIKNKIKNTKYFYIKDNSQFLNKKNKIFKVPYDYVINCHGYISHEDFFINGQKVFDQHISSIINLIYNINKSKIPTLINLGSSHEYGFQENKVSEKDKIEPISFYSYCKSFLSNLSQVLKFQSNKRIQIIHLRLFQIYGEGQKKPRLFPYLIDGFLNNKAILLESPGSRRDFLHIKDFTALLFLIINFKDKNQLELLNIGSGDTYTIEKIFNKYNDLFNKKKYFKQKTISKDYSILPDLSKLKKLIDWKPKITVDEGIIRCLLYEKNKNIKNSNKLDFEKASKISIIMNCYNGEKYLRAAIDCVINQTYQNWEVIFWDNNSNDRSKSIVKSYKDSRIKYFVSKKKMSLASARNKALKKINGSFIAFLDVDDYWTNDKLIVQLSSMVKNDSKVSYTNFNVIRNFIPITTKYKKDNLNYDYVYKNFLKSYDVGFLTFMVSRDIIEKKNIKFNTKFEIISDFEFVMRICKNEKISVCNKTLGFYRLHSESYSFKNIIKHILELKNWVAMEVKNKNITSKEDLLNINKKIDLLEYKSFLTSKKKLKPKEIKKFNAINLTDKIKTNIKLRLGY